ncbi:crustacean hyperglycemic hormone-like [Centruroides sculpturatus]|nr:crustacean hyperglycemic hormone-like [Centruroides sculpturatus]
MLHSFKFAKSELMSALGCYGQRDRATFYWLINLCYDCYRLYLAIDIEIGCRENCFTTDYFEKCMIALQLTESEKEANRNRVKLISS